jgi:hypothetical protein
MIMGVERDKVRLGQVGREKIRYGRKDAEH